MLNRIFFQRMRMLNLKTVLILPVICFIVVLLTIKCGSRNAIVTPPVVNDNEEAKPTSTKWKSSNNVFNGFAVIAAPGLENAPGELGKPVVLPTNITEKTKRAIAAGWKMHAFNQYVSDLISVRRKLPDPRDKWCKVPGRYLEDLPQTSVVICFHNEAWSVLLRTVHSVLDRSPAHLLKEIILVDDFSDMPHLKQQLDDYMSLLPKVRIIRATRREGLIRARLLGARYVTAPVLTYLDSHCECIEGWLEPLLDRIARSKTTVVCPVIDNINASTFKYQSENSFPINVGGFSWDLHFIWRSVSMNDRARHQHVAEPVRTPTIPGGMLAIDKDFFERLGTYDSGFDIWGGENLELSFKTWMCGGTLEIVPCSHVGHIFRQRSPYEWIPGVDVLKKNFVRLAEVWMDDYAKYYYQRIGYDKGHYGDITGRRELREKLGCKSFEWYLKNIYPELFIPGEAVAHGELRNNLNHDSYCLEGETIPVYEWESGRFKTPRAKILSCDETEGNQFWMYSKIGEIRRDETCLDYTGNDVIVYPCHELQGNQLWLYNPRTKLLKNDIHGVCMAMSINEDIIIMETCNASEARQMWNLENYKPERLVPELRRKIPVVYQNYQLDLSEWYR